MTFRLESERMFISVLVAAVLHGVLLIVVHKLFDLDYQDYTRPLTVQLIAPEVREAPGKAAVRPSLPSVSKQERTAAPVVAPKAAPQPVATEKPAPEAKPAPERVTTEEPAPVRTQPRAATDVESAPASPVSPWTPTLRQSVESAQVRGRGGLNALATDGATQSGPRSGAAVAVPAPFAGQAVGVRPAGAYTGQGDPATLKEGLALPVDESVYAKSASSPTREMRAAQGVSPDNPVPVVRDPGLLGQDREVVTPLAPVRMSGTPTARRADAAGTGTGGTELAAAPLTAPAPGSAKSGPVDATVYGGAAAPAGDTPSIGSRIQDLDRALSAGGRDSTASPGRNQGSSSRVDGATGPAGRDLRLPEGWDVLGALGLRPLLNVVDPALPDKYPDEIVDATVIVHIRVEPEGWVKAVRFERDSGSTELNNKITETLRQWRYEPVENQDPVYGVVTIQIRIRSS